MLQATVARTPQQQLQKTLSVMSRPGLEKPPNGYKPIPIIMLNYFVLICNSIFFSHKYNFPKFSLTFHTNHFEVEIKNQNWKLFLLVSPSALLSFHGFSYRCLFSITLLLGLLTVSFWFDSLLFFTCRGLSPAVSFRKPTRPRLIRCFCVCGGLPLPDW